VPSVKKGRARLLFSPEQGRMLGMVPPKSVFNLRLEREVEVQQMLTDGI